MRLWVFAAREPCEGAPSERLDPHRQCSHGGCSGPLGFAPAPLAARLAMPCSRRSHKLTLRTSPDPSRRRESCRAIVWQALWTSRLAVFASGVLAVLAFGPRPGWQRLRPAGLTSPFGYFGNLLAAPVARWDSVWYLSIAQGGYGHQVANTAFFPLYPMTMTRRRARHRFRPDRRGADLARGVRDRAGAPVTGSPCWSSTAREPS